MTGRSSSQAYVGPTANATLAEMNEFFAAGDHQLELIDREPTLYMSLNGTRTRAIRVTIAVKFTITETKSPFEFRRYADVSANNQITDVAIAPLNIDGALKGELVV